ncbi:hypothetical protein V2J09_014830 [Rumex salicifolius]
MATMNLWTVQSSKSDAVKTSSDRLLSARSFSDLVLSNAAKRTVASFRCPKKDAFTVRSVKISEQSSSARFTANGVLNPDSFELQSSDYNNVDQSTKGRKTKIVCTIGPSTSTREMIWKLAECGMNVARLNMSHGDHESHQKTIDLVKEYNSQFQDKVIAIMLDTKGPEVRSGDVPQPILLNEGKEFNFTITRGVSKQDTVSVNYDDFVNDVEAGDMLLVDGGMMSLVVKSKTTDTVKCVVVDGGELKSRRHLNVRGKSATLPSITEKDWDDIKFGVDNEVDFYAVSFVKDAKVVHELKKYLKDCGADIHVIVKIESADSIPNLESIVSASDGAMVARGDLGAELPIEDVPLLQEEIIRQCQSMQKPVIVATNMLESMIDHPTPTRAEVSDIAIAVREGSDAVMLSGETAHGKYPLKAVKVMHTVALRTESSLKPTILSPPVHSAAHKSYMGVMFAFHATMMANTLNTPIIVFTKTGSMPILLSHYRPSSTIFVFTEEQRVKQRLALYQGVKPIYMKFSDDAEETFSRAINLLVDNSMVKEGENVTLVQSGAQPIWRQESTHHIQVRKLLIEQPLLDLDITTMSAVNLSTVQWSILKPKSAFAASTCLSSNQFLSKHKNAAAAVRSVKTDDVPPTSTLTPSNGALPIPPFELVSSSDYDTDQFKALADARRKTKIVCTIGPCTNTREMIRKLADCGMNVARLNMSHGDHASHQKTIDLVKEYNSQFHDKVISIMLDTKGPEVRSGDVHQPILLKEGQEFNFTIIEGVNTDDTVSVNYDDFVNDVEADDILLVDGGMMSLAVKSKTKETVKCEVVDGGELKSRRHLNVRGKSATLPSITDKDWEDIKFGVDNGVDFYAVSFVKDAKVVHELKDYLKSCNADIHVIVKIESADSIPNLESIISASDGAMVARGDLGAELPIEDVPLLQEEIIRWCHSMQKPVIVATNMLESMINHPTPTRAEVSDIAIAVREGSDAIMLSGETAHGKYPLKAVKVMHTVALRTESSLKPTNRSAPLQNAGYMNHMDVMFAFHATTMSNTLGIPIIVFTTSGSMAVLLSHYQPSSPIFAFTTEPRVKQRLSLYRGVTPIYMKFSNDAEETFSRALKLLVNKNLLKEEHVTLVQSGAQPIWRQDSTRHIQVRKVHG